MHIFAMKRIGEFKLLPHKIEKTSKTPEFVLLPEHRCKMKSKLKMKSKQSVFEILPFPAYKLELACLLLDIS